VPLFHIRTEAGTQRGSPASPKAQGILKPKGHKMDKAASKMRRQKEEKDTRTLRNKQPNLNEKKIN